MNVFLTAFLLACEGGGPARPRLPSESAGPTGGPPSGCPVEVGSLTAEPIPGEPLGRNLVAKLDGSAGVAITCALESAPPAWAQLVPLGSEWRYRGDGVDPGPDWNRP